MKNIKDVEKLAAETLKCIDNIEAIEPNNFLFTRIQNRLENKTLTKESGKIKLMYSLTFALLIIFMLNILSFKLLANKNANNSQPGNGISAVASDYNLNENSNNY